MIKSKQAPTHPPSTQCECESDSYRRELLTLLAALTIPGSEAFLPDPAGLSSSSSAPRLAGAAAAAAAPALPPALPAAPPLPLAAAATLFFSAEAAWAACSCAALGWACGLETGT
jgi:hypothetical protein